MKSLTAPFALLTALCLPLSAQTTTAPAKATPRPTPFPQGPPDVASPKLAGPNQPQAAFMQAHERFVAQAKEGKAQLVFLGDSITAGWGSKKDIWDKAFGAYSPVNFGIGGDRTQHVLWRIENGELDGIKPKAVVLMIGTNNTSRDATDGIVRGITKIVETIRRKQPQANILLLAIFPRGEKPAPNPARAQIAEINKAIAKLDDGKHVHFLDIGAKFLQPDGTILKTIMPDYLHLSVEGYQIWADAIGQKLAELMK